MNNHHPRIRRIPVEKCQGNCPVSDDDSLNIILFKKDFKLRSHSIRHFGNTLEMSVFKRWSRFLNHSEIAGCLDTLRDRDCFFLSNNHDPGKDLCNLDRCPFVEDCTETIEPLIQGYISIIDEALKEAIDEPRYACFFSNKSEQHALWAMPSGNIVMKAALINNAVYNLMTCYSKGTISFGEMLRQQVEKMKEEARSKHEIILCDEDNWVQPTQSDRPKTNYKGHGDNPGKHGRKTKLSIKMRYTRGGGNARRYLDDCEDWS